MKAFLAALIFALFSSPLFALTVTSLTPTHGPVGTVVVIAGSGFTGVAHVNVVSSAGNGTFTINSDTQITYTVSSDAQVEAQPLQIIGNSLIAELTFTVDAGTVVVPPVTPPAVFVPPPAPRCLPYQFNNNFHNSAADDGTVVYTLWCDDQSGLGTWAGAGGTFASLTIPAACQVQLNNFTFTLTWLQAAWPACMLVALTPAQQTAFNALVFQWTPRLTVTTGTNQNVYTQNADGTKGPQLVVKGVGEQVAPGITCGGLRLLNAGARFADVSGKVSTDGVTLPANSYALCSISYPPSGGFLN